MVTRPNKLWQLIEESYGNSLQRLIVTRYPPPKNPVSRVFIKGRNEYEGGAN